MHSLLPLCYLYLGLHLVGVRKTRPPTVCIYCFPRGLCVSNKTRSPEPRDVRNNPWQRSANSKPLTSTGTHRGWQTLPGMLHEWEIRGSLRIFFPRTRGETHYLFPHNVRHIIQSSSQDRDCCEEWNRVLSQTHIDPFKVKTSSSTLKPHRLVHIMVTHRYVYSLSFNVRLTAQLSWPDLQLTVWHQIYSAEGCSQCTSANAINSVYFNSIKSSLSLLSRSINKVSGSGKCQAYITLLSV